MLACIILHNMVIEDEIDKDLEDITLDLNETPSTATVQEATISQGPNQRCKRSDSKKHHYS